MRCFISVDVENIFHEVYERLGEIKGLKLVEPENLHITLKFLGEITPNKIEEITEKLEFLKDICKFEITFQGLGAFPNIKRPRVIWVGIKKNKEKLIDMQSRLDEGLSTIGFKKEKRYEPHLTLARVKSFRETKKVVEVIETFHNEKFGNFIVENVRLKKSVLTPKGPIYTTIREVTLK